MEKWQFYYDSNKQLVFFTCISELSPVTRKVTVCYRESNKLASTVVWLLLFDPTPDERFTILTTDPVNLF